MTKKNKISLIIIISVAIFLILFVPIPIKENFDGGSAFTLNSLTYKVVFWNAFSDSEKPYDETEVLLPPNNFSSASSLFEEKEQQLRKDGYGAISVVVTVKKIENDWIWIKELSDDKNAINDVVISFNSIEKYGKNIATEDIKEGVLLKITNDGIILESYPSKFGKIYCIELVNTKETETIIDNTEKQTNSSITQSNNSSENNNIYTQQIPSSNNTTNNNTSSVDTHSTVSNNTSSVDSTPVTSTEADDFVPIFWNQTIHQYNNHIDDVSGIKIPYLVVEPHNYDPSKKYPVILFLHGAGYRFNSSDDVDFNELQVSTLASSFIFNYEWMTEAIIIAPQISKRDWWDFGQNSNGSLDAAMRIFEKVTKEYSCDSSRYYVTGGSMGGYATWQVASKYSEVFAAAMPMCGWWTPNDAPLLVDMPIRIIHGTADSTVSVEKSKLMYNAIKEAGGQKVVLSLYKGAEHDVWREAYFDAETWEWLFAQKK